MSFTTEEIYSSECFRKHYAIRLNLSQPTLPKNVYENCCVMFSYRNTDKALIRLNSLLDFTKNSIRIISGSVDTLFSL